MNEAAFRAKLAQHSIGALERLAKVARDPTAPKPLRLQAACEIADRAFGAAPEEVEVKPPGLLMAIVQAKTELGLPDLDMCSEAEIDRVRARAAEIAGQT